MLSTSWFGICQDVPLLICFFVKGFKAREIQNHQSYGWFFGDMEMAESNQVWELKSHGVETCSRGISDDISKIHGMMGWFFVDMPQNHVFKLFKRTFTESCWLVVSNMFGCLTPIWGRFPIWLFFFQMACKNQPARIKGWWHVSISCTKSILALQVSSRSPEKSRYARFMSGFYDILSKRNPAIKERTPEGWFLLDSLGRKKCGDGMISDSDTLGVQFGRS